MARPSSSNAVKPDVVRLEDHEDDPTTSTSPSPSAYEIRSGVEGLIGNTPLVKLQALSAATGCEILAKCEFLNGAGNSPKDRVALSMINEAEEAGILQPGRGDVVYEGTVGSTGISLAAVCRARGYRAHMYVDPLIFASSSSSSCPLSSSFYSPPSPSPPPPPSPSSSTHV